METLRACLLLALLATSGFMSAKCDVGDQSSNPIGVNYGTRGSNLPPPSQVVQLLQSTNIGKVKLYDANPAVLRAFARTYFDITVGISNDQIPSLIDQNAALSWVNQNIVAYLPDTRIRGIAVGNEVLTSKNQQLASQLLPAMSSLHSALVTLKLESLIKIVAPQSLAILSTSFPPSAGAFKSELAQSAITPILSFLLSTNSTFMVNAYPFMAYRSNPQDISLAYCLFLPNAGVTDPGTGIVYSNMFGAMLDAVISAMNKLHVSNVRIGVSETGWPSLGDPNEAEVNSRNAMQYNKNLIFYINSNPGTPLRPKQQIDTYIFSLYNENLKDGPASERNYGLFRPDGSTVYDVGILKSGSVITPPSPVFTPTPPAYTTPPLNPSPFTRPPSPVTAPPSPVIIPVRPPTPIIIPFPPPSPVTVPVTPPSPLFRPPPFTTPSPPVVYPSPTMPPPTPRAPPSPVVYPSPTPSTPTNPPSSGTPTTPTPTGGHGAPVWCVAKPNADASSLASALSFACGEGGADCSAIQPGGPCFYPNDVTSHASYAFNSYYQRQGRNYWNCDFRNNAVVAISDPSYGGCNYPAK